MRIMLLIALLNGCTKASDSTTAEGSNLQCSTILSELNILTICEDMYVRCYIPGHGGIHCIPLK